MKEIQIGGFYEAKNGDKIVALFKDAISGNYVFYNLTSRKEEIATQIEVEDYIYPRRQWHDTEVAEKATSDALAPDLEKKLFEVVSKNKTCVQGRSMASVEHDGVYYTYKSYSKGITIESLDRSTFHWAGELLIKNLETQMEKYAPNKIIWRTYPGVDLSIGNTGLRCLRYYMRLVAMRDNEEVVFDDRHTEGQGQRPFHKPGS